MTGVHRLSQRDARRLAVRAQLLALPRPADVLEVARGLTVLQLDPTAAVAPNADLVLWSRLGSGYSPLELRALLDGGALVEHLGYVRPAEDMAMLRPEMAAWPGPGELREWQVHLREWVEANDACRRDLLDRLRAGGPLSTRELPDTCARPWRSTGWTNDKNVAKLLDLMVARGEVAVVGRRGRDRLWDLTERVHPDGPDLSYDEAARLRRDLRLRSLGIARARTTQMPGEPWDVGVVGEPAVVDGVRGEWRVHPELLDGAPFRGRTALISPLDRLVHDRTRMADLFGFDYQLEMYKPAAQRRWGYFALPVLVGDRLVGKLDAKADRKEGVLRVHALHEDAPFTAAVRASVHDEIADLARWLGLELLLPDE
ncbi:DNA glycosylase AlkZ-like family protein [Angustibacter aerolatus]